MQNTYFLDPVRMYLYSHKMIENLKRNKIIFVLSCNTVYDDYQNTERERKGYMSKEMKL